MVIVCRLDSSARSRGKSRGLPWCRSRLPRSSASETRRRHPARRPSASVVSIGPAISALLSREVYYRQFANRRQVGSFLGLTPSPYSSGEEERCQGISRAGSGHVRAIMIEAAWLWIRHQPRSALTRWFLERTAGQSTRTRKTMIVAVARKLAIALWRYVEHGLVPQGAILNPPTTGNAR